MSVSRMSLPPPADADVAVSEGAHPVSPPPSFPFHFLPSSLFVVLTHYLRYADKLLHLTHVSGTFPPLTPLSFACDTLAWDPALITRLTISPSPPLLSLLSLIPYALFVDHPGLPLDRLYQLLNSSYPPFPFSALRAVTFAPLWLKEGEMHPFHSPIPALRFCPHLSALHLHFHWIPPRYIPVLLPPLLLLTSLRTLRLTAQLTASDLLFLLSLPLTCLDLHTSTLMLDSDTEALPTPPPSRLPPLPTLHTFLFPTMLDDRRTSPSAVWQRALLSSLSTPQVASDALLRLSVQDIAPRLLSCISLFHRLHILQLSVARGVGSAELVNLYSALMAYPLPLRHLRLQHETRRHRYLQLSGQTTTRATFIPAFSVLPTFIAAYAGQLLSLDLIDFYDPHVIFEPLSASVTKPMTAALLSCHSLRKLHVASWWLSSAVPTPSSPALPQLESLHLDVVSGMEEATLAVLLDACPQLQELTLRTVPLSHDVLLWVGDRCHELRTLTMTRMPPDHIDRPCPMDAHRWDLLPPSPALPKLSTLRLYNSSSPFTEDNTRALRFTRIASYLVHSAPSLRFVYFSDLSCLEGRRQLLAMLGGLTELQGLWLAGAEWMWMKQEPFKRYWMGSESRGQSQVLVGARSEGSSVWGDDALPTPRFPYQDELDSRVRGGARREEEVWAQWDGPEFREVVDGVTGSRAFFNAIAPISEPTLASSHSPNGASGGQDRDGKSSRRRKRG